MLSSNRQKPATRFLNLALTQLASQTCNCRHLEATVRQHDPPPCIIGKRTSFSLPMVLQPSQFCARMRRCYVTLIGGEPAGFILVSIQDLFLGLSASVLCNLAWDGYIYSSSQAMYSPPHALLFSKLRGSKNILNP